MSEVIHEVQHVVDGVDMQINFKWCAIDEAIQEVVSVTLLGDDTDIQNIISDHVMDTLCNEVYAFRKREAEDYDS